MGTTRVYPRNEGGRKTMKISKGFKQLSKWGRGGTKRRTEKRIWTLNKTARLVRS